MSRSSVRNFLTKTSREESIDEGPCLRACAEVSVWWLIRPQCRSEYYTHSWAGYLSRKPNTSAWYRHPRWPLWPPSLHLSDKTLRTSFLSGWWYFSICQLMPWKDQNSQWTDPTTSITSIVNQNYNTRTRHAPAEAPRQLLHGCPSAVTWLFTSDAHISMLVNKWCCSSTFF